MLAYILITPSTSTNLANRSHCLSHSERWLRTANRWLKAQRLPESHRDGGTWATFYNEWEVCWSEEHCVWITVRRGMEVLENLSYFFNSQICIYSECDSMLRLTSRQSHFTRVTQNWEGEQRLAQCRELVHFVPGLGRVGTLYVPNNWWLNVNVKSLQSCIMYCLRDNCRGTTCL